jgi:hypothetical protein
MPVIPPLGRRGRGGRGGAIPAPGFFAAMIGGAGAVHDDPFGAGVQTGPIVGWRDLAAQLAPTAAQPAVRGRPRHMSGPRNVLSGPQANVELNNVHRGHIAHREQAENHRVQQAALLQQLQVRLQEEQRQRQLAQLEAQLLDEQRQRDLELEQQRLAELQRQAELQGQMDLEAERQRQWDLAELQRQELERQAEIQRQLALELENLDDVDEFQPPEANAQVRDFIHDQRRAEHERELDPDLNDIDFDEFDVEDW